MKPGEHDRRHSILISGPELEELQKFDFPESYGLGARIFHRWRSARAGGEQYRVEPGPKALRSTVRKPDAGHLVSGIAEPLHESRHRAARAVNAVLTAACWEVRNESFSWRKPP